MRIPLLAIVAKAKDFPRLGGRTPFSLHPLVAARMTTINGVTIGPNVSVVTQCVTEAEVSQAVKVDQVAKKMEKSE